MSSYANTPENTACEKSHPRHLPPALMSPPPRTKLLFLIHNFFSRCIFTCFGLKLYTPRSESWWKRERLSVLGRLARARDPSPPDDSGASETNKSVPTAASWTKIKALFRFSERRFLVQTHVTSTIQYQDLILGALLQATSTEIIKLYLMKRSHWNKAKAIRLTLASSSKAFAPRQLSWVELNWVG